MKIRELNAVKREDIGKGASGRCRKEGKIPAVFYRAGTFGGAIELSDREFRKIAEKSRTSQVFQFKSESEEVNGKKVIIKDLQQDFLKGVIQHVDFQEVKDGDVVKVRIPLEVEGVPFGVKNQGGVITVASREVVLKCKPAAIPLEIIVDISSLKLGDRVSTGDLELPEGAVLAGNPEETIASVVSGRAARIQAAAEKKDEPGEGVAAA